MRHLLLMRHAQTANPPGLDDRQRPLSTRGSGCAAAVASHIAASPQPPELVVSSDALRALTTARAVADACEAPLREEPCLYLAGPHAYLQLLSRLGQPTTVLAVGHIPGVEELFRLLTTQRVPFTPASLAHLALPIEDWAEILTPPRATLLDLHRPAE